MCRIREQFGSLEQLRSTFCAASLGFSGSGWLWLITDERGYLAVFPTFGSGTLLVRGREHMRLIDEEKAIIGEDIERFSHSQLPGGPLPSLSPHRSAPLAMSSAPSFDYDRGELIVKSSPDTLDTHTTNIYDQNAPGDDAPVGLDSEQIHGKGETLWPLFCASVYEHAWMSAGYGVWGKEEYMKRFWDAIDWEQASTTYRVASRKAAPKMPQ